MGRAREILGKKGNGPKRVPWYQPSLVWMSKRWNSTKDFAYKHGAWAYSNSRYAGWILVTIGMITALPLLNELKREAGLEELDQIQINAQIAEGKTPQELANSGFTGAIDPNVISE
jgi:hypothetical protein